MCQLGRYPPIRHVPGCEHHAPAREARAIPEPYVEAALPAPPQLGHLERAWLDGGLLPEPLGVLEEQFEAQRAADGLIRKPPALAVAAQRVAAPRVPEIRSEALGLEHHPLRHETAPALECRSQQLER